MRNTPIFLICIALTGCFNPDRAPMESADTDTSDTMDETDGPQEPSDDPQPEPQPQPEPDPEPDPNPADETTGPDPDPQDETDGGSTGEDLDPDPDPATPRRVFTTSQTFRGDDLANADQHCNAAADEAGLDGFFVAWISTAQTDAIDRLPDDVGPYVLLDGYETPIAQDKADLVDGSLSAAIHFDEWGNSLDSGTSDVWTGTFSNGTGSVDNCLNWTVGTSAQDGTQGDLWATDNNWSSRLSPYCSTSARLYCFEL